MSRPEDPDPEDWPFRLRQAREQRDAAHARVAALEAEAVKSHKTLGKATARIIDMELAAQEFAARVAELDKARSKIAVLRVEIWKRINSE